ncbi:MAG: hypothetical protein BWY28_03038 [bacterium ADurb.Bin236]|nr:MAG: hypothetical protein BWY28_03038 [bacterium ADurb.Bin236]HPK16747.1 hypothetical protein [Clostridia bacterium]
MLLNPEQIFQRYLYGEVISSKKIEKVFDENDKRHIYIVDTDLDEHFVFKFSNNSFTSPERIAGWKRLTELYNECGIYAPKILPDKYGGLWNGYLENNERYLVYAEEKKKFMTADEYGIASSDTSSYFEDMVAAAARIATVSTELPGWMSAWCLYDKFSIDDASDETYYWQDEFHKQIIGELPCFRERADRIWSRFSSMYQAFETDYRKLPQVFFQGDEGGTNAMLDDEGKFVGMLDFNLSGAEVNLNYFFRNFCRVRIRKDEVPELSSSAFRKAKDDEMRSRLDIVKKHYCFNTDETAAFPAYYRIVYPLECDLCQMFQSVVRERDIHKINIILDWIEYQQTRNDIAHSFMIYGIMLDSTANSQWIMKRRGERKYGAKN